MAEVRATETDRSELLSCQDILMEGEGGGNERTLQMGDAIKLKMKESNRCSGRMTRYVPIAVAEG